MKVDDPVTLETIPAHRRIVEELYAHHFISNTAKEYALETLYPHKNWGLWAARLLLTIGSSLILSGIVYFFAFNWYKLTPFIKFTTIEIGIIACLLASYFYGLQKLGGRMFLLSASVLVGVFLAVFGQIYQTGADAYQLFATWALLIAVWVIISQHLALWALWVVIINIFTVLYWQQVIHSLRGVDYLIFSYLTLLNGCFLIGKEYFTQQGIAWLKPRWPRFLLVISLLACGATPMLIWIFNSHQENHALALSALLGVITHLIFLAIYRYKLPDTSVLAITILSITVIIEATGIRISLEFDHLGSHIEGLFLFMTIFTIIVFTGATIILRGLTRQLEGKNG